MHTTGRTLSVLALACCLVLAGCSGGGDGGTGSVVEQRDAEAAGDGGGGGGEGGKDSGSAGGAPGDVRPDQEVTGANDAPDPDGVSGSRALVRTGSATLNVTSYDAARTNLTGAVAAHGGFVAGSTERTHDVGDGSVTTGTVVFRVPAGNFSAFLERVRAEGEVRSSKTTTEDVTDRVVDLRARLANERAQRERLRALYGNASDTEDVLAVGEELSAVQASVERLEARLRALEGRVALSTVTVDLREPRPDPETGPTAAWYDTPVVAAFADSVGGVAALLRAAVVGLAYALPYLLVVGLPLAGGLLAVHRIR
jgi:hypothetical protein